MRFIHRLSTTRPKRCLLSTFAGCACASMVESGIVVLPRKRKEAERRAEPSLATHFSDCTLLSHLHRCFPRPFYYQCDRKGRSWHNSKLSSPSPDMWAPIPRNSTRMACPMPVRSEWRAPDGISTIAHSNGKIFPPHGSR